LRNGPAGKLLKRYMKKNKTIGKSPKLLSEFLDLIAASLAQSTWRRYDSALRLWKLFKQQSGEKLDFLNANSWSESFIVWGWSTRHLAISTLKIYLAELKKLGKFASGLSTPGGCLEKTLFLGMSNLSSRGLRSTGQTFPLTIAMLGKIRKNLEKRRTKLTGQSVWTCCLIAFWGAFRLGELLGRNGYKFDAFSDLLWENVSWGTDWIKIHIKSAKVRGPPGNSALLFTVPDRKLCPVTALARLKKSQENFSMGKPNEPIFRESSGKFLTKRTFLSIVNEGIGKKVPPVTGKSFRSALPSALENFPKLFQESHLKALGRWRGQSYQLYMRNDQPEFRHIFQTVSSILLQTSSAQENWKDDPATWTASWVSRRKSTARKGKRTPARSRTVTRKKPGERLDEETNGSKSQN
jgi:hypothetical protein